MKEYKKTFLHKSYLFFLAIVFSGRLFSSVPQWVNTIGESSASTNVCTDIVIDGSGNRYVTGYFAGIDVDFDPGAGATLLTSNSGTADIFIAKYNSTGGLVWVFNLGGTASGTNYETGYGIAISGSDIYVIGSISGTTAIDMDPSSNTNTLTGAGDNDVFVAKYDGNLTPTNTSFYKWAFRFGGTGSDVGFSLALSGTDLYITGKINGTTAIDVDPSTNTNNITGAGASDIFVAKYDVNFASSSTSFYKWAFRMGSSNSTENDMGTGISVSGSDVYITGTTYSNIGSTDFDPSVNTNTIAKITSYDSYVAKYDGSLTPSNTSFYQWAFRTGNNFSTNQYGPKILVSGSDMYITGENNTGGDFDPSTNTNNLTSGTYVAKYDGSLDPSSTSFYVWGFSLATSSAQAGFDIAVSGTDVYVTGNINGTGSIDMDPSTNTNSITGAGGYEAYVAKYDGSLTPSNTSFFQWAFPLGGTGNEYGYCIDYSTDLAVGGGMASVNVDFDPGGGTANLTTYSGAIFVGGYDNAGAYNHAFAISNSGGDDGGYSVVVDASGNTYVTGYFTGQFDADPGVGTEYLTTTNIERDIYIIKYNSAGSIVWAFKLGGSTTGGSSSDDAGYSIFVSGTDIYITGNIYGTTAIDMDPSANTNTITGAGSADVFVAKYDGSLTPSNTSFYKWAFCFGDAGADIGYNVTVSGSDVYVVGKINGTTAIDMDPSTNSNTITGSGNDDVFVAKYDGSLTPSNTNFYKWAFNLGNTTADIGYALAVSGGYLYIAGKLNGTAGSTTFDMDPSGNSNTITSKGSDDIFVAKYDASLDPANTSFYIWAFNVGGTSVDAAYAMAVSGSDVYITGNIFGTTAIDMDPSANSNTITGVGNRDMFTAKYDGSLTPSNVSFYKWAFSAGSTLIEYGYGIAVSGSEVYITGSIYGTTAIDMDPSANTNSLTGAGNNDVFVAKYDGSKTPSSIFFYQGSFSIGGANSDVGRSIAIDNTSADIFLTGSFANMDTDFDPSGGTLNRSAINNNAFAGRYTEINPLPVTWLDFTAIPGSNDEVICSWSTATETNNDYFTVERSTDGGIFESIAKVKGAGNSISEKKYQLTDNKSQTENPEPKTTLYYRLKQTDFDGAYSYSQIVPVTFTNGNTAGLNVYPNPVNSQSPIYISISGLADSEVLIVVRDVLGRESFSKIIAGKQEGTFVVIDGEVFSSGIYIVTASNNHTLISHKIVVKKD